MVIAAEPVRVAGDRLISRSMDNRLGAYVALESLRRAHEHGGLEASFAAIAAVQEEIGLFGARTSAFAVRPDLAVAVDVTHATDAPGVDEKEIGSHPLGSGPVIGRGSTLSPKVFELLVETAEAEGIDHTVSASGRGTSTDADAIQISRAGIPTGLVSIPLRYMHSPVEMVDLGDVEATVELIAAFAGSARRRRRPQPLSGGDASVDQLQLFRHTAEIAVAILGDDDKVLDPHPQLAGQVDAGLDGHDFSGGSTSSERGETRGASCTSRPTPWPSPWPKRSPWPAASMIFRATPSTASPPAPAAIASSATAWASRTTS